MTLESSLKNTILRAFGATDIGMRKNNEDAFLVNTKLGLFIVADGMGGHDKGEVASWFTSENLEEIVSAARGDGDSNTLDDVTPILPEELSDDELIQYAVMAINRRLYDLNEKFLSSCANDGSAESVFSSIVSKKRRMGTTLVSLLVRDGRAYVANVGDSRVYRMQGGRITLLTRDHSLVEDLLRDGKITKEEAASSGMKNVITRSVGFKPEVKADVSVLTLHPPERFLLCSDGLSGVVSEEEMLFLASNYDIKTACYSLIEKAKGLGGRDNITCVIVDVLRDQEEEMYEETDVF